MSQTEPTPDDPDAGSGAGSGWVPTPERRARWLSTIVSLITSLSIVAFVAAHAYGAIDLSTVPGPYVGVYLLTVAASFSYALGVQLTKRVGGILSSGVGGGTTTQSQQPGQRQ